MSKPSTQLRQLASISAVAVAATLSPAQAAESVFDQVGPGAYMTGMFSKALKQAAPGDTLAHSLAGAFLGDPDGGLRARIRAGADKPVAFLYPKESVNSMLVIAAVAPPKGYENLPIPVCAQKDNKVLATWNITVKGDVVPVAWNGATTGEVVPNVGVKPACGAFISAARKDMNAAIQQQQAAVTPPTPPPTTTVASLQPVVYKPD